LVGFCARNGALSNTRTVSLTSTIIGFLHMKDAELDPSSLKIIILLATKNGADFLKEQLASYRSQTHTNWELIVSDDSSTDETLTIIREFASTISQRVLIRSGPRLGFWQNFLSLIRIEDDISGDLFAFSDQDDVWLSEKLSIAARWFALQQVEVPALYFTRTLLIDRNGRFLGRSPLFTRPPCFQNALVQNIGGGNTMVFNKASWKILRQTPFDMQLISHDWWTYQVVTGVGGIVHYDRQPSVKYRQHAENLVGSNTGIAARIARLSALLRGRARKWNEINLAALSSMRPCLTESSLQTIRYFSAARQSSLLNRLRFFRKSGVHRQTSIDNAGLLFVVMLGRF
jgi:glycosyltransferase involved in cell wall biosynthesis